LLNLQFYSILIYFPMFVLLFNLIWLLVLNFIFYIKHYLFYKYKNSKKQVYNETVFFNLSILNIFYLFILFILLHLKHNSSLIFGFNPINLHKYKYFILFMLIIIFFFVNFIFTYFYFYKYTVVYVPYIGPFFIILVFFILFTTNFLNFFFYLELFGYLFYLQFFEFFTKLKPKNNNNAYIDAILLYYWLNFFGSIFILYGIICLFYNFNTVDYIQLSFFSTYSLESYFSFFFILIGFNLKLGAPGFQFFKVELYKNLRIDSIVNFSFYTLFIYLILIKFLLLKVFFLVNFFYFSFIFFIFLFLFVVPFSLKINNIILFFGYSATLNATLCLFLFL